METTQKFIFKNRIGKNTILRRKKDNVVIQLTGKFIKSLVGFTDFRVGDEHSWLAEYDVIESPYRKHTMVNVYSGGRYSGSYEIKDKFNMYGLGSRFLINLTLFSHPLFNNEWEIVKNSEKIGAKEFLKKTNGSVVQFEL